MYHVFRRRIADELPRVRGGEQGGGNSIANNRIEVAFNMTHNIKNLLQIKGMERVTVSVNQELNQEMARATAARTWTLRSSEWLENCTRPSPASMKSLRDHRIK